MREPIALSGQHVRSARWLGLLLFGVVFLVHTLSRNPQVGDSRLSPVVAWRFFTHFDLQLDSYPSLVTTAGDVVNETGHLVPFFPWPPMLFAAPADLIFVLLNPGSSIADVMSTGRGALIEIPTASFIVALCAVLVMQLVRDRDPSNSARLAFICGLFFAFGTSAWSVGSRALWQQTVSMLFLLLAVFALNRIDRGGRWAVLLGSALGMAVVVRPTNALFVILVGAFLLWRFRRSIPLVGLGALIILFPFLLISYLQYGSAVPPYYLPSRLSDPSRYEFVDSLLVNLISPSRGLLIYDAVIILSVVGVLIRWKSRSVSAVDGLMIMAVVCQLLVIASYGSTHGYTYGPRLMLDIVPFLVLLAVPAIAIVPTPIGDGRSWNWAGVLVTAVLVWSVLVSATGAVLAASNCWNSVPVSVDDDPQRVWDWTDPQFLRPFERLSAGQSVSQVALSASCTVS